VLSHDLLRKMDFTFVRLLTTPKKITIYATLIVVEKNKINNNMVKSN